MHIRLTPGGSPATAGTAVRVAAFLMPSSGAAAVGPPATADTLQERLSAS
jgi:hypothetical protein